MGAPNLLLADIFRILTPEELNELTSSSEGDSRISLTEFLVKKVDGVEMDFGDEENMAKILPFIRKEGTGEETEEVELHAGPARRSGGGRPVVSHFGQGEGGGLGGCAPDSGDSGHEDLAVAN